ncbi:MAG: TonB-dependent receptor plug domain-containing protein, partial [Pseudomonadota bacterium]
MSKVANTNILLAYAISGGLMMGVSAFSLAQESAVLEEVVVTAQKREESVQDVGIAITAFSGEQLDTFGFTSSTDIAQLTPGVYLSGNNGGNTLQFTVRGVANPEFADLLETPNAVYVDEGYVASGQGQMFANFDMERVEILKGPQGTLFGRNATGGLIHYITRRPTDEFEAYGDISYGSYDSIRFEGAVSGPLTEGISGRVSGFYNTHDGIWDNIFPDQLPGPQFASPPTINGSAAGADDEIWTQDEFAVRGQLLFEWRDDMELLVKGQYAEQNPGSGPYQNIATVAFLDDTDGDGRVNDLVDTRFADNVQTLCEQVNINTGACIDSALDQDFDGMRPG